VGRGDVDALVIGAGVSGLTTAICLAERGVRTRIWTAQMPPDTTSAAAGAMWGPYLVEPLDRVAVWSQRTLTTLRALAGNPETGVRLVAGVEASRTPTPLPDWGGQLEGFRLCQPGELPDGFATGWRFIAPLVDMPIYLGYLLQRARAAGVDVELRTVQSLDEASAVAPVVVNCTGIGARELVPDPSLAPIRGQLVVVENPGVTEFFSEDTGLSPELTHFYPFGDTVVLGGLAEEGAWSMEPDPAIVAGILKRCGEIDPRLRDARVIEHRVGLRPTRPEVRVEAERRGAIQVIHNYGHGGAGVTLSWGCATEASDLVVASTG
jgi:D-amino-acid oxidase